MKYKLKEPIESGEATISELTFRTRIVSGDWRGIPIDGMTHDHLMLLAGRLCGQLDVVMRKLDQSDYEEVIAIVMGFMNRGRPTGSTHSLQ